MTFNINYNNENYFEVEHKNLTECIKTLKKVLYENRMNDEFYKVHDVNHKALCMVARIKNCCTNRYYNVVMKSK